MNEQQGFSLVMAIFILVVLSLLGGYMVKLSGVQHATSVYVLQGARAYQAARAGVERANAIISAGAGCAGVTTPSSLSFTDIDGFTVTMTCNSQVYSEGVDNPVVYRITALSEFGVYNSANYISRSLEVSIVN
jgi:MSHA biogenesis protein MshP